VWAAWCPSTFTSAFTAVEQQRDARIPPAWLQASLKDAPAEESDGFLGHLTESINFFFFPLLTRSQHHPSTASAASVPRTPTQVGLDSVTFSSVTQVPTSHPALAGIAGDVVLTQIRPFSSVSAPSSETARQAPLWSVPDAHQSHQKLLFSKIYDPFLLYEPSSQLY